MKQDTLGTKGSFVTIIKCHKGSVCVIERIKLGDCGSTLGVRIKLDDCGSTLGVRGSSLSIVDQLWVCADQVGRARIKLECARAQS